MSSHINNCEKKVMKIYVFLVLLYISHKPACEKLLMTCNVFRLNYKHNYGPIQILFTITYKLKLLGERKKIKHMRKTK